MCAVRAVWAVSWAGSLPSITIWGPGRGMYVATTTHDPREVCAVSDLEADAEKNDRRLQSPVAYPKIPVASWAVYRAHNTLNRSGLSRPWQNRDSRDPAFPIPAKSRLGVLGSASKLASPADV